MSTATAASTARALVTAPAAAGADVAPVRLTRRGRALLVTLLAALLFAAFSLGQVAAEGTTAAEPARELRSVTVLPGDTLWSLASELAPGRDPRPVVDQIRRLNDLDGGGLRAGQQLLLPLPA